VAPLDLAAIGSLTFEPADTETFSCLRLAREAGVAGGTAPCTLNAANEIAVHAFLAGRIRFMQIAAVIDETLGRLPSERVHSFDSLARADAEARRMAGELVQAHTSA
jgi:1-deoxy-D-xylulose-5-phosphate reductoisomerase